MANEFVARNGIIALNDSYITGSLNVSSGITGSLYGTSSWAQSTALSITSSYSETASFATSASSAISASWAPASNPFPFTGTAVITGSLLINTGSLNINVVQKFSDLEADIIAFAVAL